MDYIFNKNIWLRKIRLRGIRKYGQINIKTIRGGKFGARNLLYPEKTFRTITVKHRGL